MFFPICSYLFVVTINYCNYVKYTVNICHTDMFSQYMLYKLIISQNNISKLPIIIIINNIYMPNIYVYIYSL